MQENTYKKGNKIHLIKIPKFGDNYRLKGEDIKKNQKILSFRFRTKNRSYFKN